MSLLKWMFASKCPKCGEPLVASGDGVCSVKACPHNHYTEETYSSLGVQIVYDEEPDSLN
ncbi:hypothetical protein J31TS4_06410 [Paenibacillus sp. J31TS4]|uniref:hypothetical protein n=1 Tax=Paenibacillus sp. J31TS4 TaxID=2807195 RepID=UPI001B094A7D|nr:hypothetical protein [Paenibacillus sp. J31TS4]GIP37361.1 hypothetical protein J31TS4_06410 [Paenibacillus sp. J31TS4]